MTPPTRPIRRRRPWSALGPSGEPDLAALPIVGITRRRAAILLGALLAGWIIILFARQVSEASAATGRAETMVADNAARRSEVAGLERELQRIQQPRYVVQQARGYGLGGPQEIAVHARRRARRRSRPTPRVRPACASAPRRRPPRSSSWLTLLFGPGD